jgi:hypothetical protein
MLYVRQMGVYAPDHMRLSFRGQATSSVLALSLRVPCL